MLNIERNLEQSGNYTVECVAKWKTTRPELVIRAAKFFEKWDNSKTNDPSLIDKQSLLRDINELKQLINKAEEKGRNSDSLKNQLVVYEKELADYEATKGFKVFIPKQSKLNKDGKPSRTKLILLDNEIKRISKLQKKNEGTALGMELQTKLSNMRLEFKDLETKSGEKFYTTKELKLINKKVA